MYEDQWVRSAEKFYDGLDDDQRERVERALERILVDPVRAPNVEPLKGKPRGRYRLRVGDLRLIYRFDSGTKILYVLLLDNRKDAY